MLNLEKCRGKEEWEEISRKICASGKGGEGPTVKDLEESLFSKSPKQREQQYAGYILLHVHRHEPGVLIPLLPRLLRLLDEGDEVTQHVSIPRQVFSVFQDREIPEALAGEVFAKAVRFFLSHSQPIAVRARALDTASNVAKQHDGLWEEIAELVTFIGPEESAGMQSIKRRVGKLAAKNLTRS